jgi:hypothetical protein
MAVGIFRTTEAPPPTGDWVFIGRFADADKAEAALTDAKAAFESLLNWKINTKE